MKLYYAPASSYSQRVLIALYEKEINFTPVEVNLFDPEVRQNYLNINPFGKVPTLVTDDGTVLFEASIIIEYLDKTYPCAPQLIPVNSDKALETRMLERIIDVYINTGREALFSDTQRPIEARGAANVIKASKLMETALLLLDERLASRTWLVDEFSASDCAAAPTLAYLRIVYNYEHLSNLTNYVKRLESRPSVINTFNSGREQMTQMLSKLKYPVELAKA
ncbi:glutathione S-transferase domain-containing protein [Rivularia sp. IAM M-261]|nr:glutathione S-transferase domain-containing protein [Calothrix sp. PCC 7716]GJD17683.1 glutathione S-transferase domain-containing protein [Rivularia sp. IAM M-261]